MALLAAVGIACSESKEEVKLAAVSVSPASASLAKGTSQGLVATAIYSNNTKQDVTAQAAWSVSDGTVLSVLSPGVAKGMAVGTATVTANFEGRAGSAALTVTAAEVVSISVTPFQAEVPKGVPVRLTAMARMTDDTVQDVTLDAAWSTSAENVAVCAPCGKVETRSEGLALITATFAGHTASTRLTVTAAQVVELTIEPLDAAVPEGMTQQMKAVGHFTDQTTQDLTEFVKWCSLNESVATVSNADGSRGLVSALEEGDTRICASYCNTFTAMTSFSVTPAVVTSLTITPPDASVPNGLTVQFRASAVFSNHDSRDITGDVVWESSDAGVASISNADTDAGLARGLAVGEVTITARAPNSEVEAEVTLAVTDAVVMQVQVYPAQASIPKGRYQPFQATAIMSAGEPQDVTGQVTWESSDPDVAPISNAEEDAGRAFGANVSSGPVTVKATHPKSGRYGTAELTVTAAVPERLEIAPAAGASIPKGLYQQFTATAVYSDSGTEDVTGEASWASSNANVAPVSMEGEAFGLAVGEVTITATWGGFSALARLEVREAELVSVSIDQSDVSTPKGRPQQFTATGIFTDGTNEDVTIWATWESSHPAIVSISNALGHKGLATALEVGTVTITATCPSGAMSSVTMTVTREELESIQVTPAHPVLPLGLSQQFTATGIYTDTSTQDLTSTVEWASDDTDVAAVSNAFGSEGDTQTLATGTAVITATYPGTLIAGTATIEVTDAVLKKIEISPVNYSMAKGREYLYTAKGIYTYGAPQDLSDRVTWTSSAPGIAPISNGQDPDAPRGEAFGAAVGTVDITAGVGFSPITATTKLTITSAELERIEVYPPVAPDQAAGWYRDFTATAIYSDGINPDVTSEASWTSSDCSIACVDQNGRATGRRPGGPVTITASYGGFSDTGELTITKAVLVSVCVRPDYQSIPKGYDATYQAWGTYSDGHQDDITGAVTWESAPDGAPHDGGGTFLGDTVGNYVITATEPYSRHSGTAALNVRLAELVWVELKALSDLSLPKGLEAAFQATGWYTDGLDHDYTGLVNWTSSDESVAAFNCAECAPGEAKGFGVGTTMISAVDPTSGKAAHVGDNSGPTELALEITAAEVVSIAVTPEYTRLPKGLEQQYAAIGLFTDGDQRDLTEAVVWNSSDSSIVDVSNAYGDRGLATGMVAGGSAEIWAEYQHQTPEILSNRVLFDVTDALIMSLYFDPAPPAELPEGMEFTASVWGLYTDDGHDLNYQGGLVFEFSDPILSIDPATPQVVKAGDLDGCLHADTDGNCVVTVTARFPDWDPALPLLSVSQDVKVVPEVVTRIFFEEAGPLTIPLGEKFVLHVDAEWSLSGTLPLEEVAFEVYDAAGPSGFATARLDTSTTSYGDLFVTANAVGSGKLVATYDGPMPAGASNTAEIEIEVPGLVGISVAPFPVLPTGVRYLSHVDASWEDGRSEKVDFADLSWVYDQTYVAVEPHANEFIVSTLSPGTTNVQATYQDPYDPTVTASTSFDLAVADASLISNVVIGAMPYIDIDWTIDLSEVRCKNLWIWAEGAVGGTEVFYSAWFGKSLMWTASSGSVSIDPAAHPLAVIICGESATPAGQPVVVTGSLPTSGLLDWLPSGITFKVNVVD